MSPAGGARVTWDAGRAPRGVDWLCRALGAALGFVVGTLLGVRRAHVLGSLRRAGIAEPARVAAAMYRRLGRGALELLALGLDGRGRIAPRLRRPSAATDVLALGRPCVVATAHTGNWDWLACAAAADAPLCVVTKHLSVGLLDRVWQRTRARRGVQLVSAGRAAREALAAIRRGSRVAMLIDQAPERARGTVIAPFLGAEARVDLAPALLALRARVPLVLAFAHRRADGSHAVVVAAVLEPPPRPSRRWAESAMLRATAALEGFVREHPADWLWMHRRWKDAADAPVVSGSASAVPS
ncbi:MAG: lysophospholipid acyltransferase family protein [Polyangiaceae bacterium]|nr:lysophospholipid acyltransferase family protein [Polyangiaceae bacterium]